MVNTAYCVQYLEITTNSIREYWEGVRIHLRRRTWDAVAAAAADPDNLEPHKAAAVAAEIAVDAVVLREPFDPPPKFRSF